MDAWGWGGEDAKDEADAPKRDGQVGRSRELSSGRPTASRRCQILFWPWSPPSSKTVHSTDAG